MNEVKVSCQLCNYKKDYIGLDTHPYFSWNYEGEIDEFKQSSYHIIVSDSHHDVVWDSEEIFSEEFINIKFEGKVLKPRTRYEWKVIIRYNNRHFIESDVSFFETGKLGEKWEGKWITPATLKKLDQYTHAPYLRKTFLLSEEVKQARMYITGLGYLEAYVNGQKIGTDILSPAYTNYDKTVLYMTYDVTEKLVCGENVIGTILGNGWYNCITEDIWNIKEASWRHVPKMIMELRISSVSGKETVIFSDSTWKSTDGPITFNSIRNGEYYNANLEIENWCNQNYDDSRWEATAIVRSPGGVLRSSEIEPIRKIESLKAVNFWKTTQNSWIFDMGQNMSGFAEIHVKGKKNDEITIRYNEILLDDGINLDSKYNSNMTKSGEFQTDKYIKKSDELEIWSPRFTYHGFQYIELAGLTFEPDIDTIKGVVVHTDVIRKGRLKTSDNTINKVIELAYWSTMSNLYGFLTDDPHREKNPWTFDSSLSAEQVMFNYLPVNIFKKWLKDIKDSQKPNGCIPCVVPSTGWGYNWGNGPDGASALTLIPWNLYTFYDDIEIIEDMYPTIKKHFEYMESMSENFVVNYGIGDWCVPFEGPSISVNMASFKTPTALTDTAYFYSAAVILSNMAELLGKNAEAKLFTESAANIKKAFRDNFYTQKTNEISGNCQTSTACMLYQGLAEESEKEALTSLLIEQIHEKNDHIDFGILGNKYVFNSLGTSGNFDLAIKMIKQKTFPGYGNIIEKGATTLWETWNGTGSRNHHMFSDVVASLYKYLGGIKPDSSLPGFKQITMQPAVDCGIDFVECSYESIRGTIALNWNNEKGKLKMSIRIPYGCTATLILPIKYEDKFSQYQHEIDGNMFHVYLSSGTYHI